MLQLHCLREENLTGDPTIISVVLPVRSCPNRKRREQDTGKPVSACVIHVHPLRLNGGGDVTFSERRLDMETRVAVLAIIVREGSSVETLNDLLHQ